VYDGILFITQNVIKVIKNHPVACGDTPSKGGELTTGAARLAALRIFDKSETL
jgi:hypothetical protein